MSIEFLDCLKHERDISIKPIFSGGKTTFRCTPALKEVNPVHTVFEPSGTGWGRGLGPMYLQYRLRYGHHYSVVIVT